MRAVAVAVLLVACDGGPSVREPSLLGEPCETSSDCVAGLLCQRERALRVEGRAPDFRLVVEIAEPAAPICVPQCVIRGGPDCALPECWRDAQGLTVQRWTQRGGGVVVAGNDSPLWCSVGAENIASAVYDCGPGRDDIAVMEGSGRVLPVAAEDRWPVLCEWWDAHGGAEDQWPYRWKVEPPQ